MPLNGAQQRAQLSTCSYVDVTPQTVDKPCTASRHGTRVAYDTYGCRCTTARLASSRAREARRARQLRGGRGLMPACGTVRRLRAVAAIGHTMASVAADLGWEWQRVADLRAYRRPQVNIATHTAVAAVYDRLADAPGPSTRARAYAARHGWLGPLWWDDDTIDDPTYQPATSEPPRPHLYDLDPVAVDRALASYDIELTRAERLTVVTELHRAGNGYLAIAAQLHVAPRQVHRDLVDLDLVDRRRHLEETS